MAQEILTERLVPFRWPADWTDPGLMRLVAGSTINCLLLDGGAEANRPIAAAAQKAGLVVRERTSLAPAPLAKVDWSSPAPIAVTELVWPRIAATRGDATQAGPTGAPWIDSNCWVARLARVRAPGKAIWLEFAPPKDEVAPGESAYQVAIADSAAAGARWIVSLHDDASKGLRTGDSGAQKTWQSILTALAFFEKRRGWASYDPSGVLGVLSTFAGDQEFMGMEVLNLAARRNLQYRILERGAGANQKLAGLKAILYLDGERPSTALKAALAGFCRGGGLLIAPEPLAVDFPGETPLACPVAGYKLQTFGKGKIAIATRDWDDPYFLAADTHSLVGRRNDPVLMYNAQSLWQHYSTAPSGRGSLLQLVGFTGRANTTVSVRFSQVSGFAMMYVPEAQTPTRLEPEKVDGRPEFHLPAFTSYAALEVQA